MSRQSRAYGASLALHAAALLATFGLSSAVERSREARIIDLSILLPSGGETASLPEWPLPRVKPPRPVQPPVHPRPAPPREAPPPSPPPPAPAPAALPPPVESVAEPAPVPAVSAAMRSSQEPAQEDAAPVPLPDAGSSPAVVPDGETSPGSATAPPASEPAQGTASASALPEKRAGSSRPELVAAVPSATPSVGTADSGASGDAGLPWDVAALRSIIKQHLVYPGIARRMGWEGKVLLSFIICGNGRARDVTLLESSGRNQLDRHALETVSKISSFPTSATDAKVIVPVVYRLD